MRTVHVVQLTGVPTQGLKIALSRELNRIHKTPPHPSKPDSYRDFHLFKRNCTTLIRDALKDWGFKKIRGILPRELFSSTARHFLKIHSAGAKIRRFRLNQLKVPEAPYSRMVPIFNPLNRVWEWKLAIREP
jgi:hypothetical protein